MIRRMLKKPVQQGRRGVEPEAYPLEYVEDFDDPRTKLAGVFSILLAILWPRIPPRSDRHLDSRHPLHVRAQISKPRGD
jgi:hypothetical protein